MAVPTVSVVSPQRSAPSQEIVLPGNVQPYVTAPIFSRTNGYLQAWYFDIGAHVRKGQLLAVIATPEVDQQLGQSRSNLSTAEANLRLAEITKNRYEGLLKSNAVSQQDADNAVGTYNANKSIVEADQANVKQIGLINQIIVWLGGKPVQLLIESPLNTFLLIIVMIWIQAGFAMTVLSAAIKAIPDDIIEAARLDGVNAWSMFRQITVPSVRPTIVVVLTTIGIGTLKVFDIVRTMTGGNFGTSVLAYEFYVKSFRVFDIGLGSALAMILFILVVPIVIYNVRSMRKVDAR